MITVNQILNATNGGLDIILSIYPQARVCVGQRNKHFAIRDEKTPSASLRQFNSAKYGAIWQVTDFGGEGRGENAIDIFNGFFKRFLIPLMHIQSNFRIFA